MDVIYHALLAAVIAQFSKLFTHRVRHGEWKPNVVLWTSGMPSSHSAAIVSATFRIGIIEGFNTTIFALALVVSFIIMYDAVVIRRQAGLHAKVINEQLDTSSLTKRDGDPIILRDTLGHTPSEVVMGFIVGVLVAFIL